MWPVPADRPSHRRNRCAVGRHRGRRRDELGGRRDPTGPRGHREARDAVRDWGIPTAASVLQLEGLGLGIIATGGVKSGLDIARALALGANAGGMARPFLMAHNEGGRDAALQTARELLHEVRVAMLLSGAPDIAALREVPRVIGPDLARWKA